MEILRVESSSPVDDDGTAATSVESSVVYEWSKTDTAV